MTNNNKAVHKSCFFFLNLNIKKNILEDYKNFQTRTVLSEKKYNELLDKIPLIGRIFINTIELHLEYCLVRLSK